jgi:dipeptidyl aminopeptidase/acylaminoacyl peptidase
VKNEEIIAQYHWLKSEGLKICYYFARPINGGPCPLILLNHGGGGMDSYYQYMAKFLAVKGYAVAVMVFRGFPPSEGRQEYGNGEIRDLINLINHLQKDPSVDGQYIGALGNSRGGLKSLLLACAYKPLRFVAAWSAPVEMFRHYELHQRLLEATIGGDPQSCWGDYMERSVIYQVDKIECPVLLVHGQEDLVVPVWHARSMLSALQEKDKQVDLIILEEEGHNFSQDGLTTALCHTLDFLEKNIKKEQRGEIGDGY